MRHLYGRSTQYYPCKTPAELGRVLADEDWKSDSMVEEGAFRTELSDYFESDRVVQMESDEEWDLCEIAYRLRLVECRREEQDERGCNPIRIWPFALAPLRYRQLFREGEEEEPYVWIVSLPGPEAKHAWWPDTSLPAAVGSFVNNMRAGVLFQRTELEDETIYFVTNNNPEIEVNAEMG